MLKIASSETYLLHRNKYSSLMLVKQQSFVRSPTDVFDVAVGMYKYNVFSLSGSTGYK